MAFSVRSLLPEVWTATRFASPELTAYAERLMIDEARDGITALSLCSLLLLSGATLLHELFGLGTAHTHTCLALAALSLHILIAGRGVGGMDASSVLAVISPRSRCRPRSPQTWRC